jgi:hypothetical protein
MNDLELAESHDQTVTTVLCKTSVIRYLWGCNKRLLPQRLAFQKIRNRLTYSAKLFGDFNFLEENSDCFL